MLECTYVSATICSEYYTVEYGSEVWEGNKNQAAALQFVLLCGPKRICGCSSETCNGPVRGDMGLQGCKMLASMSQDRHPRRWLFRTGMLSHVEVGRRLFGVG